MMMLINNDKIRVIINVQIKLFLAFVCGTLDSCVFSLAMINITLVIDHLPTLYKGTFVLTYLQVIRK